MTILRYELLDVFTTEPLSGNPLAVFPDGAEIDASVMQMLASEMNLAETTFILPSDNPSCVARFRIFTPKKEMDFAGHPTLGTSFVLLSEGLLPQGKNSFFVEERVGPVHVVVEQGSRPLIWLATPPILEGRFYERDICASALGLKAQDVLEIRPQLLSAGNPTLLIPLKNEAAVDRAWLDVPGMRMLRDEGTEAFCVFIFCLAEGGVYSRMFAPDYGIPEDPATGSSTGPLAAFLMKHGLIASHSSVGFVSEQGRKMGRRSRVHVRIEGRCGCDGIFVGGNVTPIGKGTLTL